MDEKKKRGFAALSPERHREIARKGGHAVPKEKRSFSTDHDLASTAGKKGGCSVAAAKRSFSQNKQLAAEAGAKGGKIAGRRRAKQDHSPDAG